MMDGARSSPLSSPLSNEASRHAAAGRPNGTHSNRASAGPVNASGPSFQSTHGAADAASGETIPVTARGYVNVDALPVSVASSDRQIHPWHYDLCHLCRNCDSCLEAWFCTICQVSRQCEMVLNGRVGMHWPICLLVFLTPGTMSSCIATGLVRDLVRKRYAISGSSFLDCLAACCCNACVVQQILLEMTVNGDCPGGVLCTPHLPQTPQGDVEMT